MTVLAEPYQPHPVPVAPVPHRATEVAESSPGDEPGDDLHSPKVEPPAGETTPIGDEPIASSDPFDDFEDDDFDDEFDDDFEEEWDDDPDDDGFGPEFQDDEGDEFDVDADDKEEQDGDAFKDDADFDD